MAAEITVPTFPESVTDGTLVAWRKQPGERVARGEILADVETDKVVFEVPAAEDGVLAEVNAPVGTVVTSGQVIGRIGEAGAATAVSAKPAAKPETVPAARKAAPAEVAAMPAARKAAAEQGLDLATVAGSGRGGRVLKEDVLKSPPPARPAVADRTEARGAVQGSTGGVFAEAPKAPPAPPAPVSVAVDIAHGRPQRREPMSRLRARIAERLVQAQHTAAMLTTFNEINLREVMALREKYRGRFEQEHGVKLGFMSFFVRACVEALKQMPSVNASIEGADVVYHGFYDIGIAVSSPRGLTVPVLRDADRLHMAEIERRIKDFAERARDGKLQLEELTGGTFTITNGGVFGSLLSTPILNPPQSAILGMHKIQERPVAENGQVVIRPMMYVALSYDHRLIDGREAVTFLVTIKELLEDPARLLLEI
jgi:2-oxoglutarate dehydrogenase E2 component (dihydrolipoamide succinyltransferase)